MISGAHTASTGRGKGRLPLPCWKGFQPYRCFFTQSERRSDLLGCLCSPRLVRRSHSSTRCAAGTGSLLLFKRFFRRQRSCARSKSRGQGQRATASGSVPTSGCTPPREREDRHPRRAHHRDGAKGRRCRPGSYRRAARAAELQWVLTSLPTPKSQTALAAPGSQPSPGLQHRLHSTTPQREFPNPRYLATRVHPVRKRLLT